MVDGIKDALLQKLDYLKKLNETLAQKKDNAQENVESELTKYLASLDARIKNLDIATQAQIPGVTDYSEVLNVLSKLDPLLDKSLKKLLDAKIQQINTVLNQYESLNKAREASLEQDYQHKQEVMGELTTKMLARFTELNDRLNLLEQEDELFNEEYQKSLELDDALNEIHERSKRTY